ncbi:MAG: adenylate/guanylate cyclase domain-containing protein [Legionella sp.]|nr:MAG: adenylate/guanylate cyclase domain-containing protein [Legionella sp.]PJD99856.1 MAG: adenylate/guanylate cyclase domain-containing protein [Legionella sp.]
MANKKKLVDASIGMQELEREVLRSEILRLTILMLLFFVLTLYVSLTVVFFPAAFHYVFAYEVFYWVPIIISLFITLYYFVLRWLYKRAYNSSQAVSSLVRYISLFIEMSIPTLILYVTVVSHPVIYVLISPRLLLYSLFITLSALTLNRSLCIFAGVVAAVEYSALSFYVYFQYQATDLVNFHYLSLTKEHTITSLILNRSGFFFLGGCVTAFITQQIKNRLFAAFEATKQREHIAQIFGRHVSPEVVDMLLQDDKTLVSESKDVCVLFLDIRGFTTFSENKAPEEVVNYLNYLFGFMVDIINSHHGIINKFLGDGFMAVFGAPLSSSHITDNALNAAMEMIQRIKKEVADGAIPETRIGIGIHYGRVVTGTIGAFQRQEYTVIGDVVNLASRIEKLNKEYQSQILISEDVYTQLEEKRGTLLGEVTVMGRHHPIKVYEVL